MDIKHISVPSGIAYSAADESNVQNAAKGTATLVYVCTGQDD